MNNLIRGNTWKANLGLTVVWWDVDIGAPQFYLTIGRTEDSTAGQNRPTTDAQPFGNTTTATTTIPYVTLDPLNYPLGPTQGLFKTHTFDPYSSFLELLLII